MVAEGYVKKERGRDGERDHYTLHSVKNLTKLAHWVVEIEEAIGSNWRKDQPAYWLRLPPRPPKRHTLPEKANKNFKADLEELNYS